MRVMRGNKQRKKQTLDEFPWEGGGGVQGAGLFFVCCWFTTLLSIQGTIRVFLE